MRFFYHEDITCQQKLGLHLQRCGKRDALRSSNMASWEMGMSENGVYFPIIAI